MTKETEGRVLKLVTRDTDIGSVFRNKLKSIQAGKNETAAVGLEQYRKGGEALRGIRDRLNLTRKEFAGLFNISDTIVGKWERAECRPKTHTLLSMKFVLEKAGFRQYADMIRLEDFGYNESTEDKTD